MIILTTNYTFRLRLSEAKNYTNYHRLKDVVNSCNSFNPLLSK